MNRVAARPDPRPTTASAGIIASAASTNGSCLAAGIVVSLPRCRSLFERHVFALDGTHVDLSRAADSLCRRMVHLHPMRNPARQAAESEQHSKHLHGNPQRPVDN